jgi:YfiH family protein
MDEIHEVEIDALEKMNSIEYCMTPDWPAPRHVRALQTTRQGGISTDLYNTFNLGLHVGDDPVRVIHNRMILNSVMPSKPVWLDQVHGTIVANADLARCRAQADACIARQRGSVCVVMTADCLPVLLCDTQGGVVGAVHAGWKGLAAGVIEATVGAMNVVPQDLMAWLGPAISQQAFEVGDDVRDTFVSTHSQAASAFVSGQHGKWLADIYALARLRLNALGVTKIYGGDNCTFSEEDKYFSYRRNSVTGRMGTFIWLE